MNDDETSHPHIGRRSNRLADEQSPYLRQHAYNPVDWYPWGEEALARAIAVSSEGMIASRSGSNSSFSASHGGPSVQTR